MPLRSGKANIQYNLKELMEANKHKSSNKKRDLKQMLAIAYSSALRKKKK